MFTDDLAFLNNVRKFIGSRIPSGGMEYGSAFNNIASLLYNSTPAEVRAMIPGMNIAQNIDDTQRFWSDYRKNTGKSPRYPGMQIHTRDFGDAMNTARSMDWWL